MIIKPFLLNKTAICISEPKKLIPNVIYPTVNGIYTIRDVVIGTDKIGLLLHEIHNVDIANNKAEITFDKQLFTLVLYDWERKANTLIHELYNPKV